MARYNVDLQDNEGNAYQIMANPDSVAEFSPAANRENIRSGETHRIIFGKIMKYLSEVGNAAYVGLANNCTTTVAGFALDARQGKELMDRVNELNRDLGGCSFEQDGVDFYIVGADSVRKKLAESPEYSSLDCGNVDFKEHEFGQWHHGYHFTKVSEIPNFGSMVHGKDFFIEVYNGGTNQENVGIGVSYVKHSNSELVMTSVNGLKSLNVKVYYISNRAIPSPSSFLKSVDFTIASGTATKNILLSDITDAGEIVCAGLVSRGWEGWNALNVTYTTESVTITFSTSNSNGTAFGSEIVRVWYR